MLPRILLVYRTPSPFVLQDRDLLTRHTRVIEFQWADHDRPARALARVMFRRQRDYDLVLAWFGDLHASVATRVARWLRKPVVVVIGGYDLSDIPGYGFLSRAYNVRLAERHFERASRILAVSGALRDELVRRFPGTASKTSVLPTGIDTERFCPNQGPEPKILSVALVEQWPRALIKGWDCIPAVARRLPEHSFLLVGSSPGVAERLAGPANLAVRGPVSQSELIPLYQQCAVFLHPSRSEGLPNALLEAMSCGCVPVATSVGGIPEAVGDAGVITSHDPEDIAAAVRRALASPDLGKRARERVERSFSLLRREHGLLDMLAEFE